jgi:predicted GNAT superfamily acetyltransferase
MLEIRDLRTVADLTAVEELQREVWGFSDLDVVSGSILRVMLEIGGVLLGAFDGETLVAFNSGFAGYRRGHLEVHSDMLAVREAYRDRGLGYRLKMAQRDRVLAMGIDRITWTFDPLRSRNGYFNFRKLGVVSDEYRVNFYGESTSSFLHGTGTDRLWVTWFLNRSIARVRDEARPGQTVKIPREIDGLSTEEQWKWRESTRARFEELLNDGFVVTDYDGNGTYTLTKGVLSDFAA